MRASPAWAAAIAEEPPEVLAELQPTKLGGIYINVGIVHYIHVYNFQICSVCMGLWGVHQQFIFRKKVGVVTTNNCQKIEGFEI